MSYFLTGALVGLFVAVPVGPVAIVCARRSLINGVCAGFVAGLGAALADVFWSYVAAGVLLVAAGCWCVLHPPEPAEQRSALGPIGDACATFALTLANPMVLVGFMTAFAAFGVVTSNPEPAASAALIAGVFTGSATLWLLVSLLARSVQSVVARCGLLHRLHRAMGALIILCGIAALLSACVAPQVDRSRRTSRSHSVWDYTGAFQKWG